MGKINCIVENGIAYITIDDGKVNAMDNVFFDELNQAIDLAEKNSAKVVAIAGRENYFSAGLNLKYVMGLSKEALLDFNIVFARTILRIYSLPIPTMSVCTGHAIAGGAMLAYACDLRYIAKGDFTIQMNETTIGLPVPEWMQIACSHAIPNHLQTKTLLHGKPFSPDEAVSLNLFDGIIDVNDNAFNSVKGPIEELSGLNQNAYGLTKRIMREENANDALKNLDSELAELLNHM